MLVYDLITTIAPQSSSETTTAPPLLLFLRTVPSVPVDANVDGLALHLYSLGVVELCLGWLASGKGWLGSPLYNSVQQHQV